MPSEHCVQQLDLPFIDQSQVKLCSSCHCQLSPDSINVLHSQAAIVCTPCRERICALSGPAHQEQCPQLEDFGFPVIVDDEPVPLRTPTPMPVVPSVPHSLPSPSSPIPIPNRQQHSPPPISPFASPTSHTIPQASTSLLADPYADITRLRVRSHSQDCLYPGAQFSGTQKSGRSSYEVSVSILDVDFSSSFLCGYLRIRGLTEDYPELTTYFDAQIIGSRYGFLTDGWGASEQEDMTHWARFPAFQKIKQEMFGPHHTIRDRERDCVFMRWKERFLVPDHKIKDINGASFAGFYYVCVDFNPQSNSKASLPRAESPTANETPFSTKVDSRPGPALPEIVAEDTHIPDELDNGTATMSGFYFHQNSEPYQHLSLRHVPEDSTGTFEFR